MSVSVFIRIGMGQGEVPLHHDSEDVQVRAFDAQSPEVYNFPAGFSTRLVTGTSKMGERIFEELSGQERDILFPKGRVVEYNQPIEPQDPEALRNALVRVYDLYACSIMEKEPNEEDMDILRRRVQPDLGAAVLLCERAIVQGRQVYWTLW